MDCTIQGIVDQGALERYSNVIRNLACTYNLIWRHPSTRKHDDRDLLAREAAGTYMTEGGELAGPVHGRMLRTTADLAIIIGELYVAQSPTIEASRDSIWRKLDTGGEVPLQATPDFRPSTARPTEAQRTGMKGSRPHTSLALARTRTKQHGGLHATQCGLLGADVDPESTWLRYPHLRSLDTWCDRKHFESPSAFRKDGNHHREQRTVPLRCRSLEVIDIRKDRDVENAELLSYPRHDERGNAETGSTGRHRCKDACAADSTENCPANYTASPGGEIPPGKDVAAAACRHGTLLVSDTLPLRHNDTASQDENATCETRMENVGNVSEQATSAHELVYTMENKNPAFAAENDNDELVMSSHYTPDEHPAMIVTGVPDGSSPQWNSTEHTTHLGSTAGTCADDARTSMDTALSLLPRHGVSMQNDQACVEGGPGTLEKTTCLGAAGLTQIIGMDDAAAVNINCTPNNLGGDTFGDADQRDHNVFTHADAGVYGIKEGFAKAHTWHEYTDALCINSGCILNLGPIFVSRKT